MAFGLRVFDSAGVAILDTTSRVATLVAKVTTSSVNGSYTVPASFTGNVFASVMRYGQRSPNWCEPTVTVSGRVVSWVYNRASYQTNINADILIGVY